MLPTGQCHITLSPVKNLPLPPCDAAFRPNSLTTCFIIYYCYIIHKLLFLVSSDQDETVSEGVKSVDGLNRKLVAWPFL